jgi:hypothetical protein
LKTVALRVVSKIETQKWSNENDSCMTTASQLHNNYMTSAFCTTIAWQLYHNCMTTEWQIYASHNVCGLWAWSFPLTWHSKMMKHKNKSINLFIVWSSNCLINIFFDQTF